LESLTPRPGIREQNLPILDSCTAPSRYSITSSARAWQPIRARSYSNWFRHIARAAGIPDEVWNMDARAGGATEAHEAGASLKTIQTALTHDEEETSLRYIRRRPEKVTGVVADLRNAKRPSEVIPPNGER
jgi:hypothetical protein